MNVDNVLKHLKDIEDTVSQVRDLLFCPEGIRIVAIWREGLSYVEYREKDFPPRIIYMMNKKVEEPIIQQHIFDTVGTIPPSSCGEVEIELCSDIEQTQLSGGVQMAIDVFEIKFKEVTQELLGRIRERNDFNSYMSRLKDSQRCAEQGDGVRGDEGISDSGSPT